MKHRHHRESHLTKLGVKLQKSLKIALAALISIIIAEKMNLEYSATAGIITILSIQNTKKETLVSARNRGLAFICAVLLAYLCFQGMGYHLPAFALYLFLFAMLCLWVGWQEAIAMDSVLISHFLIQESMSPTLLLNEIALFIIGTVFGIVINLNLHKNGEKFEQLADDADMQIKQILHRMSYYLQEEDKTEYQGDCFARLSESLEQAKLCAAANYNNSFLQNDTTELDYIRMREQQSIVLQGIYENIKSISYLPGQTSKVAKLLQEIEQGYHKNNTVKDLLEQLKELLSEMKKEELPVTREEFEARAILYYILIQLEKLLMIKRDYWTDKFEKKEVKVQ